MNRHSRSSSSGQSPKSSRAETTTPLLIYGAYGYTGSLVVREAVQAGLAPILAGRDAQRLRDAAAPRGLPFRVASLSDPTSIDRALDGVRVVLNCAGPFSQTAVPMVDACLRRGVHYADITGEFAVFEAIAARDEEARARGVTLLPGVGFDVVPSDCLAAHVARRLPDATHLALAFRAIGGVSRGTAATVAENVGAGGVVRRDGAIVPVPAAWRTRRIDFGDGRPSLAVSIPWGDVVTAWHSTGIPNVEVYMAMTATMRSGLLASRWLGWLLTLSPVRRLLVARAKSLRPGPNDAARARGETRLWAEARNAAGGSVVSRLIAPEGYTLTSRTAVAAARRLLAGGVPVGFQTPSRAFGADFILDQPGVEREDATSGNVNRNTVP